jgi:pimeloyl-ACP methyl ester carboxylesterase
MDTVLNGARIHYERAGAGMPLVLLHAGVADHRMWESQVSAFAKQFDVIRPDIRGCGDSELPPEPWNPREDLLALMDELALKPAHLVGCSIGGGIALDFALDHPERVSKLVLVGSGMSGFSEDERHEHLYEEAMAAEKSGDHDAINQADLHLWLDGPYRPHGYVAEPLRKLFLDMNGKNIGLDWSKSPTVKLDPPAARRLHEISAPTLVIVGDKDLEPIREVADSLAGSIAGARKAVIEDAAHLPNLEHPERFNRLVLEFLLE